MASVLAAITTPDVVVLGVCALWAIRGAFKGFAWQLVRLVGLAGALVAAMAWHKPLGAWIHRSFSLATTPAEWAGFFVIFAAGLILATFFAYMAKGAIHGIRLGGLDRAFGALLGAVFMFTLLTLVFLVWGSVWPGALAGLLEGSLTAELMPKVVDAVAPHMPEGVRDRWEDVMDEIRRRVEAAPAGG
jgi:uncharacterized membrane protein required for colicin V production